MSSETKRIPPGQARLINQATVEFLDFVRTAFSDEELEKVMDAVWEASPLTMVPVGLRLKAKAAGELNNAMLWGWGINFLIDHARRTGDVASADQMEARFSEVTDHLERLAGCLEDLWPATDPTPDQTWVPPARAAKYGIDAPTGLSRLAEQGFACAVCSVPFESPRSLRFDHNHGTGEFRGFLCTTCNTGLGHLRDNPRIVAAALDYLTQRGHYGTDPEENP